MVETTNPSDKRNPTLLSKIFSLGWWKGLENRRFKRLYIWSYRITVFSFLYLLVYGLVNYEEPQKAVQQDNSYEVVGYKDSSSSKKLPSYKDKLNSLLEADRINKESMPQTRYEAIIDSLEREVTFWKDSVVVLADTVKYTKVGLYEMYKQIDSFIAQLKKFGFKIVKGDIARITQPKKVVAKRKSKKKKKSIEDQFYDYSEEPVSSESGEDMTVTDQYIEASLKVIRIEGDKLFLKPNKGFDYPGKGYISRKDKVYGYFAEGDDKTRLYINFDQIVSQSGLIKVDAVAIDEFDFQEGINLDSQDRANSDFFHQLSSSISASFRSVDRYSQSRVGFSFRKIPQTFGSLLKKKNKRQEPVYIKARFFY